MEGIFKFICIGDCRINRDISPVIDNALDHIKRVNQLGHDLSLPIETTERNISNLLGQYLNLTGGMIQENLMNNAFNDMVEAGSKGNKINLAQVMSSVGQQSVEGKRIQHRYDYNKRTLSWFTHESKYDIHSRGFVRHSYYEGLDPCEFFFHTMGGREGLVDTSVKTADTGYLQRKIVKALESFHIGYDHTVRTTHQQIIDFVYGGDGCDAAYLIKCQVPKLTNVCQLQGDCIHVQEFDQLIHLLKQCELLQKNDTVCYLPVDIKLLLQQEPRYRLNALRIDPSDVYERVQKLLVFLKAQRGNTLFLRTSIAFFLRSRYVSRHYLFTPQSLDQLIDTIRQRYELVQIQPGEAVGILAAESVGHPCTQLTLNTFHFSGIAAKNATLGVPRIKELLNASHTIESPITTVQYGKMTGTFKNIFIHRYFSDVIQSSTIHSLDDAFVTYEDKFISHIDDRVYNSPSIFYLRFVFDKRRCRDYEISLPLLRSYIIDMLNHQSIDYAIKSSTINMPQWIIHVSLCDMNRHWLRFTRKHKSYSEQKRRTTFEYIMTEQLGRLIKNSHMCGIPNITDITRSPMDPQVLYTTGVNLYDIWNIPDVFWSGTYSNDLYEIESILGIEATIQLLYQEMKHVLSFDGSYVDHRHIVMIVNAMTYTGSLLGLTRHGVVKNYKTLEKCTFERGIDILLNAAIEQDRNELNSVSDNIMFGQRISIGTGMPDILLSTDYYSKFQSLEVINTSYAMFLSRQRGNKRTLDESTFQHLPIKKNKTETPIPMNIFIPDSDETYEYTPASPIYNPISPITSSTPMTEFHIQNDIGNFEDHFIPSTPTLYSLPSSPVL